MTIVVPQGGADQYLMKKYRTKDWVNVEPNVDKKDGAVSFS